LAASQTDATAWIAPKVCQGQPQQCTHSAPDFIKISSLSAELSPNTWTPFLAPLCISRISSFAQC